MYSLKKVRHVYQGNMLKNVHCLTVCNSKIVEAIQMFSAEKKDKCIVHSYQGTLYQWKEPQLHTLIQMHLQNIMLNEKQVSKDYIQKDSTLIKVKLKTQN